MPIELPARWLSFKLAAADPHPSPSALSRQIADNRGDPTTTPTPPVAAGVLARKPRAARLVRSTARLDQRRQWRGRSGRVDFASSDADSLELAATLGAHAMQTDFIKPPRTWPIVVDAGASPDGLQYAIRATEPEGVCQSVSFYPGPATPLPLGRMYTLGVRLCVGRCHAAALLPEVVGLIAAGRLHPEAVTTRVADWEEAPQAFLEPGIKLVVQRA